jgi:hypothetical protein
MKMFPCFGRAQLRWLALLLFVFALSMESATATAQAAGGDDVERQVKAAYLFKFGGYVEWPDRAFATADGPIRIGVVASPTLADELAQTVAGRAINGRQISVQKLKPGDSLAGIHILFVGHTSNDKLAEILASVKGQPVLTVTESEQGLAQGGVINFVIVGGKLRFEISSKAAQQGSLNISARLLSAALKAGG